MIKDKPKIFDGITIFLMIVLIGLIVLIGVINYRKETNIQVGFNFISAEGEKKQLNQIVKDDFIMLNFSGPIKTETVFKNIIFEPKIEFDHQIKNNHQLEITLKENPVPDFNYKFKIDGFKSKWGLSNESVETSFSTYSLPKIREFDLTKNQKILKVDKILKLELEEPLNEQYFIKIKTEPEFEFQTSEIDNSIEIKPIRNLAFDTEYKMTMEVGSKNHLNFKRKIGEFLFKTERPPTVVYGWDENGEPTKSEFRTELLEPAIQVGRYIDINLSDQNLYIFENGKEIGAYKVSTGIKGMETPIGEFKVMAKAGRPWSAQYGLFMPWFIQFTNQGHGIHELPEWPGGYKEGANHLGIAVSHGCVRLGVGPAKKVYDFVETGTSIVIHY